MREIKLSEELDRYNTKLFPPKYHYKYFPFKYRLIVDGERWEQTVALRSGNDERFSALLWGDAIRNVEGLSISELAAHFSDIQFALAEIRDSPFSWAFDFMEFRFTKPEPQPTRQVLFKIDQDFDRWSAPFSISDLSTALQTVAAAHPELGFAYWQGDQNLRKGFGVSTSATANESLKTMLSRSSLIEFENHVEAALAPNKLVRVQFNFPVSIRNACEQYLIYFVQFLSDLGIDAGAELKEEAHGVLFTVKPRDQSQALEQIWKALEIYLQIPALKEFDQVSAGLDDIAVFQLKANLAHFHGQVQLWAAQVQLKNATIAAKDAEISLLKERFDLRRFFEKVEEPKKDESAEMEAIVEGVVGVRKLVLWSFLQVELPEILRKLKRRF